MKKIHYITQGGVCSQSMVVEMDENERITHVEVQKGCPGNTKGLVALLIGMPVSEAIARLEGIGCRDIATSCPDQLAHALKQLLRA